MNSKMRSSLFFGSYFISIVLAVALPHSEPARLVKRDDNSIVVADDYIISLEKDASLVKVILPRRIICRFRYNVLQC